MFHLQKLVRRPFSPVVHYSLHRALLLSTAAGSASPVRFAAEDYLVTTCGLTREQAAESAKHIAHCKSPAKANAVLSFLASPALGFSKDDIAHLVAQDARILNCSVEVTLRPRIDAFFSHGFTAAQIRTFFRETSVLIRFVNVDEKLSFWLPFLGSQETFLRAARNNMYLLTANLDRVVKVNIQLLRESGLSDADISKLCVTNGSLLCSKPDAIRAILARAQELGIQFPCNSLMFKRVLSSVSRVSQENMAAKLKFIGQMLGCSDTEVAKAVKTTPMLLACSPERLHRVSEYLTKVVGVDSMYILHNPTILTYSIERRIAPRHHVMKVLMDKGLMRKEQGFYSLITLTDESFRSKYIIPHEDVIPGLADAYASACKGKLPPT